MNFYRRRPLALAVTVCLLAAAAVAFLPGFVKLAVMAAAAISVPTVYIFTRRRAKGPSRTAPYLFLTAALMLAVMLTSYGYFDVHFAAHKADSSGRIRAVVTEIESETSYSSAYTVRLESVDGSSASGKGVLFAESVLSLGVGDLIETDVEFVPLEEYFDYSDSASLTAVAHGYVFACRDIGRVEFISRTRGLEVLISEWRASLSAHMGLYLDHEAAVMADALVLGDRDGLDVIKRDFTYIGVSHLLALSGLHISVIRGIFERFLRVIGVGKRIRTPILLAVITAFVALIGFPLSAVRAAIMLAVADLADLIGRRNDRVTALFAAVFLIVCASPASIFDVGLQLSFFATLGVVLVTEAADRRISDLGKPCGRFGRLAVRLLGNVCASVGATMFILPLMWLYFGEISTMCVLATLVLSFVCELLMILLIPYLALSLIGWSTVCNAVAAVITLVYKFCAATAHGLSELSSLISLNYPFTLPIMIICIAVIAAMMAKNVKSWLWSTVPFAASCAVFMVCIGINGIINGDRISLDYVNYGSHDAVLAVVGDKAIVLDMTNGSGRVMSGVCNALADECVTEIDTLIVTDLKRNHISSVRSLLKKRRVETILLPSPRDRNSAALTEDFVSFIDRYGADVVLYSRADDVQLELGGLTVDMPAYTDIARSERQVMAARFSCDDMTVAYAGTASWEDERVWQLTDGADYLIVGTNGPKFKTPPASPIPDCVTRIYCPSEDLIGGLGAWLDGFDGAVINSPEVEIVMKK